MKTKFHRALLSAALILISTLPALAVPVTPISGIPVGLEGDPGNIIVARTQTDADGKFEFKGLKAGKYWLVVLPSGTKTALGSTSATTPVFGEAVVFTARVFRITNVRANANLRVEGNTELVGDDALIPVDPKTGRSLQSVYTVTFGGTLSGELKIADNASPRPTDRKVTASPTGTPLPGVPAGTGVPTGTVTFDRDPAPATKAPGGANLPAPGKLTLSGTGVNGTGALKQAVVNKGAPLPLQGGNAKPNPQPTPTGRVTAIAVDPMDSTGDSGLSVQGRSPGDPIPGTEVGLEGDPEGIVATTQTDAAGKFEFKGLKAGKYRLVLLPSRTAPGAANTTVRDGAHLQLQRTFTITVTPVNDAPSISLLINPTTGRSDRAILVGTDGGIIRGAFKIAENESPRPADRKATGSPMPTLPGAAPENPMGTPETRPTYFVGAVNGGVWKQMPGAPITLDGTGPVVLGVTVQPATGGGLTLASVANGSLARSLGLQSGDRLLAINGNLVNSHADLVVQLNAVSKLTATADAKTAGSRSIEPLSFNFLRNGQSQTLELRGETDPMVDATLSLGTNVTAAVAKPADPNAWRYKQQNSEWLYYGVDEKWLVQRNGKWVPYQATGGTGGTSPPRSFQDGNADQAIFDRWGNRVGAPLVPGKRADAPRGNKLLPVPGDYNGDGKPAVRTAIPGIPFPRQNGPSSGNTGGAVRRALGGK